jgi:hypothetical protein
MVYLHQNKEREWITEEKKKKKGLIIPGSFVITPW